MNAREGFGLPKRIRVRKRREYLAVQRGGRRIKTAHFLVYGRANGGRPARLGITVSKKVGKAHVRNRVKRLVREAFRLNFDLMPPGVDLVFVAKQGCPADSFAGVVSELRDAAERLKVGEGRRADGRRARR